MSRTIRRQLPTIFRRPQGRKAALRALYASQDAAEDMGLPLSGNRRYCPPDGWEDLNFAASDETWRKPNGGTL